MQSLLTAALIALSPFQPGPDSAARSQAVDRIFAPFTRGVRPGATVAVLVDGRVAHLAGYGYGSVARRERLGPASKFLLGSVSKQFTAMAVMILAERGQLSYDDPLRKFCPEFPAYADSITVRHLLNHLAGFPEYEDLFVERGLVDRDWPRSVTTKPSSFEPTAKDALRLLAEQAKPRFPPGDRFEYSNSGYMILAQIVERVSGRRFADFLRTEVFQPLGMSQSVLYDETTPPIPGRVSSYRASKSGYREIDYTPFNHIYGEDNVVAPIDDMVRWLIGLEPGRLVSPATLDQAYRSGRANDGTVTGYGFGWQVRSSLGLPVISHGGSWLGFRTAVRRYPDQRLAVVVLANQAEIDPETLAAKVSAIYLGDALPRRQAVPVAPRIVAQYLGTYTWRSRLSATIRREGNQLWFTSPLGRDQLAFDSDSTAFFPDNPMSGITFRRGPDRRVKGLTLHRLETELELERK